MLVDFLAAALTVATVGMINCGRVRRSFRLDGSGDFTIDLGGGQGAGTSQTTLPSTPANLAASTAGAGLNVAGVGIRRVIDGTYVATAQRSVNGTPLSTLTIDAATLAPYASLTEVYTLDVFDTFAGGWGWIAFDSVQIPGTLAVWRRSGGGRRGAMAS